MTARTPIRETFVFEAAFEAIEKSCNVTDPSSADSMRIVRRTTQAVKRFRGWLHVLPIINLKNDFSARYTYNALARVG